MVDEGLKGQVRNVCWRQCCLASRRERGSSPGGEHVTRRCARALLMRGGGVESAGSEETLGILCFQLTALLGIEVLSGIK